MTACIYGIKNNINSKYYVGQTNRLLSDEDVFHILAIDEFVGECRRPLSFYYGVSRSTINSLCAGKTYKNIHDLYSKLDKMDKIDILKKAIEKTGYKLPQGGEMFGVIIHYLAFDKNMSKATIAEKLNRTTRSIDRVLKQETIPKSREIYSSYDKNILKELYLLYINNIVLL